VRDWARAQRANIPNPQRIIKVDDFEFTCFAVVFVVLIFSVQLAHTLCNPDYASLTPELLQVKQSMARLKTVVYLAFTPQYSTSLLEASAH
jgi:hypothetical protein